MKPLPHTYTINAKTNKNDSVSTTRDGLESLSILPPVEFGGPGNYWSPEELLTAAVADCFILSFKAIASYQGLDWQSIDCRASATLDKHEGQMQFTHFSIEANLFITDAKDQAQAGNLLEKAKKSCFVSNSLKAPSSLNYQIQIQAKT